MLAVLPLLGGCASSPTPYAQDPALPANAAATPQPQSTKTPNWDEVDKTVQRVRAREQQRPQMVETQRIVESGYFPMTDEQYAAALDSARADVRKANPKWNESEVETEAVKRADQAKDKAEHTYVERASSTYEYRKP